MRLTVSNACVLTVLVEIYARKILMNVNHNPAETGPLVRTMSILTLVLVAVAFLGPIVRSMTRTARLPLA